MAPAPTAAVATPAARAGSVATASTSDIAATKSAKTKGSSKNKKANAASAKTVDSTLPPTKSVPTATLAEPTRSAEVATTTAIAAVDTGMIADATVDADAAPNQDTETFQIDLVLPGDLGSIQILVLPTSTIQDIRQVVYESPKSQFYTCFYIAHDGKRQSEHSELHTIQGFPEDNKFVVVQDIYNENEVRIHVNRLREILTAYQPSASMYGIDQSASFLSSIDRASVMARETLSPIKKASIEGETEAEVNDESTEPQTTESKPDDDAADANQVTATPSADKLVKVQQSLDIDAVTSLLDGILDTDSLSSKMAEFVPSTFHVIPESCLQSIALSSWNPPPLQRRMAGDLLYLSISILEGIVLEVTASVSGFYINGSSSTVFDPLPNKETPDLVHMLPLLLSQASPKFNEQFNKLQEQITGHHPFEYILTSLPAQPWVIQPQPHKVDPGRSMDMAFLASDALDAIATHDWNEELQSARDLSHETSHERITRDQAVFKAHSDFVDAAVRGAVNIVKKIFTPINPLETDASQMYIHNNIFFSEGYDNRDQFDPYGGVEAAHVAASKDVDGIRLITNMDPDGVYTIGTAVVDFMGRRIVCQSIVPGLLHRAANNEPTVQYGSIDSGKEISANPKFEELISTKLAKGLHLKPHTVLNDKDVPYTLYTSVETKGVFGTDSRSYILDLFRLTPVDIQFLESVDSERETNPYPHRMVLLRSELVESFYEHKMRFALQKQQQAVEEAKKNEPNTSQTLGAEETEQTTTTTATTKDAMDKSVAPFEFDPSFNMDTFTHAKNGDSVETTDSNEMAIREISLFVTRQVDTLVHDVIKTPSSIPADSDGLTKMMHRRGINMRYLGRFIHSLHQAMENSSRFIYQLSVQETVLRVAKRILRNYLKELPQFLAGACIAHFLNCYYSDDESVVTPEVSSMHTFSEEMTFLTITPAQLHAEIRKQVEQRFRHKLDAEHPFWKDRPTAFVRALALKVGFQLQFKAASLTFSLGSAFTHYKPEDIANVYPIVKHAQPRSSYAEDAFEHGRYMLIQNRKELGVEILRESLSMSEQIYGPIHPDVGRIFGSLAMIYFNDDELERALYFQQRAIIVSERINGVDSAETIQQYMNLAYFEFVAGHSELGLKYMKHASRYWLILCDGSHHPDTSSIYSNLGSMLQRLGHGELAVSYFELAVSSCIETHGLEHQATAHTFEALAKSQFMIGEYRKAIQSERPALKFFETKFGKEDERTIEASEFLKVLMSRAVSMARLEKGIQSALGQDAAPTPPLSESVVSTPVVGSPVPSTTPTLALVDATAKLEKRAAVPATPPTVLPASVDASSSTTSSIKKKSKKRGKK
ncbi:hypothetical protein BASA61_008153 [Batrachochytrium salamandrivorans]|nr:hypothetical protein BASA61_008153 [Batrachochytrium salamandrivorans]